MYDSGKDDDTNVQLYDCNGGHNQKWAFISPDIPGVIVSKTNGKCLHSTGEFKNGVNVTTGDCDDDPRRWIYDPDKNHIDSKPTGGCLDVHDGHDSGHNVQMWECDDDDNQEWFYHPDTGEIKGKDNCLDVSQDEDKGNVQIYDCNGGDNQKWEWTALPMALVPFPVSIPIDNLTDSWTAHLLGSRAKTYTQVDICLLYTSPSPRDRTRSRMPSSA